MDSFGLFEDLSENDQKSKYLANITKNIFSQSRIKIYPDLKALKGMRLYIK